MAHKSSHNISKQLLIKSAKNRLKKRINSIYINTSFNDVLPYIDKYLKHREYENHRKILKIHDFLFSPQFNNILVRTAITSPPSLAEEEGLLEYFIGERLRGLLKCVHNFDPNDKNRNLVKSIDEFFKDPEFVFLTQSPSMASLASDSSDSGLRNN